MCMLLVQCGTHKPTWQLSRRDSNLEGGDFGCYPPLCDPEDGLATESLIAARWFLGIETGFPSSIQVVLILYLGSGNKYPRSFS